MNEPLDLRPNIVAKQIADRMADVAATSAPVGTPVDVSDLTIDVDAFVAELESLGVEVTRDAVPVPPAGSIPCIVPEIVLKPVLSDRERLALAALDRANGYRLERSHAQGEDTLYYVIDTNKAEPEVNHPGELVAGPVTLDVAMAIRKQCSARELMAFAGDDAAS